MEEAGDILIAVKLLRTLSTTKFHRKGDNNFSISNMDALKWVDFKSKWPRILFGQTLQYLNLSAGQCGGNTVSSHGEDRRGSNW